jgi:hypothetical protein
MKNRHRVSQVVSKLICSRPLWLVNYGCLHRHEGRGEYRQAAGAVASKLITGPVPMSAFGGKADIGLTPRNVRF